MPGLNLIYAHLNRQIRQRDLHAIYVTGPGHGGPALVANAEGYGWRPVLVTGGFDGEDPAGVHQRLAAALDDALDEIRQIQHAAREAGEVARPAWPMLILRTPKGCTGPKEVDGKKTEDSWRSHQVPMAAVRDSEAHVRRLEQWLKSYRPEEPFDEAGRLLPELRALSPEGERRMSANPHANGGKLTRDLVLPDFRDYAVEVESPATATWRSSPSTSARSAANSEPGSASARISSHADPRDHRLPRGSRAAPAARAARVGYGLSASSRPCPSA